jgi:hypothetical protein
MKPLAHNYPAPVMQAAHSQTRPSPASSFALDAGQTLQRAGVCVQPGTGRVRRLAGLCWYRELERFKK